MLTNFLGDAELKALMSDGYNAYVFIGDGLKTHRYKDTDHQVCLAHVRAKFVKARMEGGDKRADVFLDNINRLFRFEIPSMLSFLAERNVDGYVPGITNIIEGGYQQKDGSTALSAAEKIERGKTAIGALAAYRAAKSAGHEEDAQIA